MLGCDPENWRTPRGVEGKDELLLLSVSQLPSASISLSHPSHVASSSLSPRNTYHGRVLGQFARSGCPCAVSKAIQTEDNLHNGAGVYRDTKLSAMQRSPCCCGGCSAGLILKPLRPQKSASVAGASCMSSGSSGRERLPRYLAPDTARTRAPTNSHTARRKTACPQGQRRQAASPSPRGTRLARATGDDPGRAGGRDSPAGRRRRRRQRGLGCGRCRSCGRARPARADCTRCGAARTRAPGCVRRAAALRCGAGCVTRS